MHYALLRVCLEVECRYVEFIFLTIIYRRTLIEQNWFCMLYVMMRVKFCLFIESIENLSLPSVMQRWVVQKYDLFRKKSKLRVITISSTIRLKCALKFCFTFQLQNNLKTKVTNKIQVHCFKYQRKCRNWFFPSLFVNYSTLQSIFHVDKVLTLNVSSRHRYLCPSIIERHAYRDILYEILDRRYAGGIH